MKKPTLLYIPLILLFVFALSVLAVHYRNLYKNFTRAETSIVMPFSTVDGKLVSVAPEGEAFGFQNGDRLLAINGRMMNSDEVYHEEMAQMKAGENSTVTVERQMPDGGEKRTVEINFTPQRLKKNLNYYSLQITGLIFTYLLPTFCILLGFWVVFVRPQDFLAWLLLFIFLGFSAISFEGSSNILLNRYAVTFFCTWALSMFLFGIYFPERLALDEKHPWAKWILIVPLALQIFLVLLGHLEYLFGVDLIQNLPFAGKLISQIFVPLNMLAVGLFFACIGYKSGTVQSPDSRRRLRLMLYGTSVAMLPSFFIILYRVLSGSKGSFFDIVPFWFALYALLSMMLFPLTLAYVIVVQRAMDVSVVVRQGLQYALAKGGVRVLQFFLLVFIALGVGWAINRYGQNGSTYLAIIVGGIALLPLIDLIAKNLRVWIDRKFFREAYNAEQILSDLSEEVRTMVETKPLLETVSHKISESLHVPQVALLLKHGNSFQPAYALGYKDAPQVALAENDKTIEKLKANEPLVVYQDDEESWFNEEAAENERENLRELNSQLLLPVGAKNELSGVISLSPKLSDSPYTPNDLRLLKSVAAQTGLALENSRLTEAIVSETAQRERLNREVEIAREVQERLFPQELPKIEGLDYYGACRPALGVGGDYYDFLELPDDKFGIAIGDVSGKGIGASLMMASLQASLRGQAMHFKSDLAELMKHVNWLVYEASTSNRYATFFHAQYDRKTRKLAYVNAGHNPPFLVRRKNDDFEVLRLKEGGAVIGMLPPMLINYKQGEIEMQAGDLLVGFTDGISEAMNPQEEEWSEESMLEAIKSNFDLSAVEMLEYLIERADEFANGAKQHDDMTAIIVRVI